jgi:hypothetical protein
MVGHCLRWRVEATDQRDAIEEAAQEFKTDPNKLLAVKRS